MAVALDVAAVRKHFPVLDQEAHGHRLVYLDSADSAQKPRSVLDAMTAFKQQFRPGTEHAGIHPGHEEFDSIEDDEMDLAQIERH